MPNAIINVVAPAGACSARASVISAAVRPSTIAAARTRNEGAEKRVHGATLVAHQYAHGPQLRFESLEETLQDDRFVMLSILCAV